MSGPWTVTTALIEAARTPRGIRTIEHDGRARACSYAELLDDVLRLAGGLHDRGLSAGDRVALVMPEVGDFVPAFFAIGAAGLVPVPLVPPAHAADLRTFARQTRHLLHACRAAAVVTSPEIAPLLDVAGLDPAPIPLTVTELRQGGTLTGPLAPPPLALLQFTSGSTAAPKGVALSHESLHANVSAIVGRGGLDVTEDDVSVSWLPLHHDMGLIGMLIAGVHATLQATIMSPVLFLKRPTAWLDALSRHRGTVSFAPNFAYDLCLRRVKPSQVDAFDLSAWRIAGCGAEPIRAQTLVEFAGRFARCGFRPTSFLPSYGLAEHSLAVAFSHGGIQVDVVDATRLVRESMAVPVPAGGAAPTLRIVACGRPFPGHEIRVVDDHEQPLPDRHVGHIVARGPSVMTGYLDNPAATHAVLRNGWLHTGDLGYLADGQLYVCGRTKDLIIRHGRKYHPPDLEFAIADLQGIRPTGVVVFGISHVDETDEVVAVLEARASAANGDVAERVRRRVREAAGLEVDQVVVAPPGTIPRTTSGKIRRAETRARYEAGTLLEGRPVAALESRT
jgi:fatty-acyl-CoA synthase